MIDGTLTITYEWTEEGWWVAEIAEVPGAISQGRTKPEAKTSVLEALDDLLAARRDLARETKSADNLEVFRLAS